MLPGLLAGSSPVLIGLVGSSAIMLVVLYLAHGFSARTTTALIGTLFGLGMVTALGAIGQSAAKVTGLATEETLCCKALPPDSTSPGWSCAESSWPVWVS